MKISTRLAIFGLCLVNGMATAYADVIIDGQHIQAADISSISIHPETGDINVSTLTGDYTVTRSGDENTDSGPSVVIETFTASALTILEGQSVALSWSTTDADACTPSQGVAAWSSTSNIIALPSGSMSVTLNTAASYTFRLDCSNDTPSSTSRTVKVTVEEAPTNTPNDCPAPTLSGSTVGWQAHFGQVWPDPRYSEVLTSIPTSGFLAIRFDTGSVLEDGGIVSIPHTSTEGSRLAAISECPGDFLQRLPSTLIDCTELFSTGGGLGWNTFDEDVSRQCELERNTTYYLNLTFTDGVVPGTNRCSGTTNCRTTMRVAH